MLRDPFTVDDEAILYVPRAASERVLGDLEQALRRGTHPVALIGAVGIGKSLLFKVAAQRLVSQACCVPVSYEGWSVAELCQWVIRELDARETLEGERALAHRPTLVKFREWMQREKSYLQKGDPETALLDLAGDLQGRGFPIVLLVDDADSMKPDTAARLVELTAQSNGGLVLGLALTEGAPGAGALRGALAPGLKEIRFFEPMTLEETTLYVKERLAKVGASRELRACLDDSRIRRIYRYTEGNPRRVHGEVGLLHLELSRVRAGIAVREGDVPRFEPIDEPATSLVERFDARPAYTPAAQGPPAPSPWRLREEPELAQRPEAEPEVEVDEAEIALAALTPAPLPAVVEVEPEVEPEPVQLLPVVAVEAVEGVGTTLGESAPFELLVEDQVEEPLLEGLAEFSEGGEELELEVVEIEALAEAAPTEPPAAIPPMPFELEAPKPEPLVQAPIEVEAAPLAEPVEDEPHLIAPEMLARLRASAAEEEEAERRAEPEPEPASLHAVAVDEKAASPELYASVRRDWEDLSQRSAPLTSVSLPAPEPVRPVREEPPPAERSLLPWAAAAGMAIAAGVALVLYLTAAPQQSRLPGVASSPTASSTPADPVPTDASQPPAVAQTPEPTPAPEAKPAVPAPVITEGAEPVMIPTNINAKPWARIEIDGTDAGETPLGEVILSEGPHSFRATMPDGRVVVRTEKISRSNSRILFE